ncbi:hypothetical protein QJS04_geneDACA024630 [Acorus gramineus]|uniref:Uncharacterized protein n=1 Tax=Acorus gramineus TaxID=55184 RepID=A0AAV9B631_ACOGR|nr:hypothetical protein QJS04_geneDACA024630 [Acorus gramineus]
MSVFVKSRQDKSGRAPYEEMVEVISQMEHQLSVVLEPEQTQVVQERVFTSVMGPDGHGRVRTFSFGPSPTNIFGRPHISSMPSQEILDRMHDEIHKEIRDEIREEVFNQLREEMHSELQTAIVVAVRAHMECSRVTTANPSTSRQINYYIYHYIFVIIYKYSSR